MNRPAPMTPDELAEKVDVLVDFLKRRRVRAGNEAGDDPPRRPVKALAIARCLGLRIGGSDDSRKRGTRELIRAARALGHPIVSDLNGYWWAEVVADHEIYRRFRRRTGLQHLAAESQDKRSDAAAKAAGQMALFGGAVLVALLMIAAPNRSGQPDDGHAAVVPLPHVDLRIDLNQDSAARLQMLPGIGPELAARIVAHRQANGPFEQIEDLTQVRGINSRIVAELRPWAKVSADRRPTPSCRD